MNFFIDLKGGKHRSMFFVLTPHQQIFRQKLEEKFQFTAIKKIARDSGAYKEAGELSPQTHKNCKD